MFDHATQVARICEFQNDDEFFAFNESFNVSNNVGMIKRLMMNLFIKSDLQKTDFLDAIISSFGIHHFGNLKCISYSN